MFQSVDRYVDFICKHKINQQQFLFLYLLRRKNIKAINKYKETFPTGDGSMIGEPNKQDLITRGFIVHVGTGTNASDYKITDKFNIIFLNDPYQAADEFWSKYPGFIKINGTPVPLTNMDRYQFALMYAERIDYSVEEHKEVIKDLEYGQRHNLLRTKIETFVRSEAWSKIRQLRVNEQKIAQVDDTLEENF